MVLSKTVSFFILFVLVYTVALVLIFTQWSRSNVRNHVLAASKRGVYSKLHNASLQEDSIKDESQANASFRQKVLHVASTVAAKVDSWLDNQAVRKQHLNDICRENPSLRMNMTDVICNKKDLLLNYIVDDKYRIVYGFILKVGSTHWKSAFLVLKGEFKTVEEVPGFRAHGPSLKKLSQYSPDEIEYRLRNYTTFMFVRDPLARVLSAYRDKFEVNNQLFRMGYGRAIIKRYREKPSQSELKTGANVTFAEFVRFITDKEAKNNMEWHWKQIYQMMLPCNIQYDYIGKLETGKEDAEHILKYLKVDHLIHFKDSRINASHTEEVFNKYYNTISSDYLHKLYQLYSPDFQLFGYSMSNNLTERKIAVLN